MRFCRLGIAPLVYALALLSCSGRDASLPGADVTPPGSPDATACDAAGPIADASTVVGALDAIAPIDAFAPVDVFVPPDASAPPDAAMITDATVPSDAPGYADSPSPDDALPSSFDASDAAPSTVFPPDASSLAAECAAGPTVMWIDSTGEAGGGPWPATLSQNEASWLARVTSGVYTQLNVNPTGGQGAGWIVVLNGITSSTPLGPGHYSLPPGPDAPQFIFDIAGVVCEAPAGSLDIYAFGDTGGDEAVLTQLVASFDVECNGARFTGCLDYSATPTAPPPVPAADPSDPAVACGGSARDVIRVNDQYETNFDSLMSVRSVAPGDLEISGDLLELDFTLPNGAPFDVATYGPGAPAGAPVPDVDVIINGDGANAVPTSSFTLYDFQTGDAGQVTSLVLGYESGSGATLSRGCVRYAQ